MADVIATDGELAIQSFPNNVIGMLVGAAIAGLGLFLIGANTSGAVTRIVGFIIFLIGTIVFTL